MNSKTHSEPEEIVITMPPSFSIEEASQFRGAIQNYINDGRKNFLLDFSQCRFIDSTGLGVIVSAYKKCAEASGGIKLRSLDQNVLKVFKLTRLDNVFEIL